MSRMYEKVIVKNVGRLLDKRCIVALKAMVKVDFGARNNLQLVVSRVEIMAAWVYLQGRHGAQVGFSCRA